MGSCLQEKKEEQGEEQGERGRKRGARGPSACRGFAQELGRSDPAVRVVAQACHLTRLTDKSTKAEHVTKRCECLWRLLCRGSRRGFARKAVGRRQENTSEAVWAIHPDCPGTLQGFACRWKDRIATRLPRALPNVNVDPTVRFRLFQQMQDGLC